MTFPALPEWRNVSAEMFRAEIAPLGKPAVLRGVVAHWPAIEAGRASPEAMCAYIKRLDLGRRLEILVGPASIEGRFFYQDDSSKFNFQTQVTQISAALDAILDQGGSRDPLAIFVQSAQIRRHMPAFLDENGFDYAGATAEPRIWIGNRVIVPTHFDPSYNLACVVAGRRRFTLFPPDQLANLYISPLDNTPAATPVSMASLEAPDFERYPRFAQALETAQSAELEPGDAIYIPYAWWHHVRSLERFNVLVNYWWNDAHSWVATPYAPLMHAVLGLRDLPADQRAAWRNLFDYYVFGVHGEPLAHVPPDRRGALGPLTPERASELARMLCKSLGG